MGGPPDIAHTHVPYTILRLTDGSDIDPAPLLTDFDLVVCSHPDGSASLIAQVGRLSRSDRPAAAANLFPPLLPQGHFHGIVPVIGDLNIPTIPSATLLCQNHERGDQEDNGQNSPGSYPLHRHILSSFVALLCRVRASMRTTLYLTTSQGVNTYGLLRPLSRS